MSDWGYSKLNGPHTWAVGFPIAGGNQQSPIDLPAENCQQEKLPPLKWSYDPAGCKFIVNTGSSWKVQYEGQNSSLEGGPLPDTYLFEQAHMHWGRDDQCGSEHTVSQKSYAGEIHFVHYNSKYGNFAAAADKPDGLAVLGILFELGPSNPTLQTVIDHIPKIKHKNDRSDLPGQWNFLSLLPNKSQYWTYSGSLTTPPCLETVRWIVFKETRTISSSQLKVLRSMKSHGYSESRNDEFDGCICENYRPPMPLCGRVVCSSSCC